MKVLLIDADSTIPNIPIMKLSSFHKSIGDQVDFVACKLPYYPQNKRKPIYITDKYDKVYCSVIYEGNKDFIRGDNIIFGGTGFDLTTKLIDEVEQMDCDYSIYPDNDTSYGFITRGCIRNCSFCVVRKKEGYIKKVSDIDKIVKHKKVKFLDNNILAYPDHLSVLHELVEKGIKCQFKAGLDIRLVTEHNSVLLSKLNYLGDYIFAYDNIKDQLLIRNALSIMGWRKPWQFKFLVYVHPDMTIHNTLYRVEWLRINKCLPFIMRDKTCWQSSYSDFYVDIAAYYNQPRIFKNMNFKDFLQKRHPNSARAKDSLHIWRTSYK